MTEMDKLESYLSMNEFLYSRFVEPKVEIGGFTLNAGRNQIIVFDEDGKRLWDAVCHYGSYGYEQGLLEIMGTIVNGDNEHDVVGHLTAQDIINRIEVKE